MTSRDEGAKVDVKIPMPLAVGNWLLLHKEEFRLYPADRDRIAEYSDDETYVTRQDAFASQGINLLLGPRTYEQGGWWIFKYPRPCRRPCIAGLFEASRSLWSLKVTGREHLDLCVRLADALLKEFNVSVSVKLVSEKCVEFEKFDHDFNRGGIG